MLAHVSDFLRLFAGLTYCAGFLGSAPCIRTVKCAVVFGSGRPTLAGVEFPAYISSVSRVGQKLTALGTAYERHSHRLLTCRISVARSALLKLLQSGDSKIQVPVHVRSNVALLQQQLEVGLG